MSGSVTIGSNLTIPADITLNISPGTALTFLDSSKIIVYGTINCNQSNINIPLNHSFDIKPGAKLNFSNGSSLIVYGNLDAQGTSENKITFDFTNPYVDNGIKIDSGAIAIISNAVVKNAFYGIFVDEATPTIENCEIKDCVDGLYLINSDYQITTYERTCIWNNQIHDNGYYGILLINSSPSLIGNTIYNNAEGVRCIYSSPYFGDVNDYGFNNLYDNDISVFAHESYPLLGFYQGEEEDFFGGYNAIDGNDYYIVAELSSYVWAQNNWWYAEEPNTEKFDQDIESVIEYKPFLTSSPFERNMKHGITVNYAKDLPYIILTNTNFSLENKLRYAVSCLLRKDTSQARRVCMDLIKSNVDSSVSFAAIDILMKTTSDKNSKEFVKDFLKSISKDNQQKDIYAYSKIIIADIEKDNYIQKIEAIISSYPNSKIKPLAYFKKLIYYIYEERDINKAKQAQSQMQNQFSNHTLTNLASHILNEPVQNRNMLLSSSEDVLLNNYPNPFNPVTKISFTIKEVSPVTLRIYNILGEEITTLINETKQPGKYDLEFNSEKYGLSSGVYIYQLRYGSYIENRKMLLVK